MVVVGVDRVRLKHLRGSALGFHNLTNMSPAARSKPADSYPNYTSIRMSQQSSLLRASADLRDCTVTDDRAGLRRDLGSTVCRVSGSISRSAATCDPCPARIRLRRSSPTGGMRGQAASWGSFAVVSTRVHCPSSTPVSPSPRWHPAVFRQEGLRGVAPLCGHGPSQGGHISAGVSE